MGSESKIIRDEKFLGDIINSIDEKIQKCFKSLNHDEKEVVIKVSYAKDSAILDSISKLEILRQKYYTELQNLNQKNK